MAPLWAAHPFQRSDQARCQPARLPQVTAGASQRLKAHKLVRSLWLLAERVCGFLAQSNCNRARQGYRLLQEKQAGHVAAANVERLRSV